MRTTSLFALTFPVALLLASPSASAQPVDAATKSAAREVAEDALKLYDKGDYAGAYEKANRANDLVHAPTMALLTGRCLEKLGRLVEASEKYLEATHDTLEPGASNAQKSAQVEAEKARTALLPRIPAVELALEPPAPDARVLLDGKHVPPAMIGIKRPIDPGKHTISISRGGESATQDFTMKEADSIRIVLQAPKRAAVAGPTPGYYPPPSGKQPPGGPAYYPPPSGQQVLVYPPGPTTAPMPAPVLMKRRSAGLFATGIVLIPVGAITTIVGVGVLIVSNSHGEEGSPTGVGIFATGALLLAGGITMTVVGGKKVPVETNTALLSPPKPKASFTPFVGPTSGFRVQF